MKTFFDTTALALVLALGVGATLFAPSPAQADGCVRVAALDLNGDGWIDTPERHAALNAGFRNLREGGKLYISEAEMSGCLQGTPQAFRWLQGANPRYASYTGAAPMAPSYAPAAPTYSASAYSGNTYSSNSGSSYDRGAAYDTPAPVAQRQALDHLRSKVFGPTGEPPLVASSAAPEATMMPAAGPTMAPTMMPPSVVPYDTPAMPGGSAAFDRMDANRDGVITRGEYLDYQSRHASTY
jgi:hypothetical protein